ncbi:sigma-70 family RNA polymerase sigma factor [Amycolatopsis sp. NPDC058278]|uniref:sigma-70 family RNA polymerase sigma factor n=1 Tax=Amycolatopsis sp. NPDC058278 TaxID=3346417 RepID=UPI0036D9B342
MGPVTATTSETARKGDGRPPRTTGPIRGGRGDESAVSACSSVESDSLRAQPRLRPGRTSHGRRARHPNRPSTPTRRVIHFRGTSRARRSRRRARVRRALRPARRAIDRVRAEQSARDREDRVDLLDVRQPFDDVVETALSTEERQQVRAAMSALTDLQRESIQLAYFHGLTCREVAEKLGVAVGTVKTRMRDGMIRLRDALGATR